MEARKFSIAQLISSGTTNQCMGMKNCHAPAAPSHSAGQMQFVGTSEMAVAKA